ncbi:Phospholipase A2-like protein Y52B11A.8 [Toxocara canis]|uniref:Phospholipase A2-like protein Y52B11A.8 n=1 Tax=Toxocara canis TaxID=6265 RepID=A0A0B2W2Z6_TOXCA|nr:Phospholipase A2-like protein Y52B11A.8 [Toxocara canis]
MLYLQSLLLLFTTALCTPTPPFSYSQNAVKNISNEEAITVTTQASTGKDSDEDSDSDENERINWECGTDDFTKIISESTIDRDCPELKVVINDCCLAHDDCYDKQLGRANCDETFCSCLDNATRSSEVCSKEDAPAFCALVREFGELPYKASAKSTAKKPNSSGSSPLTTTLKPRSRRPTPKRIGSSIRKSTVKTTTIAERPQIYAAKTLEGSLN